MKKIILAVLAFFTMVPMFGQTADTTMVNLDEIVVASFYSSSLSVANVLDTDELLENNYGQEPSNYFAKMPSIISLNDNGTEFGYGYFRIRGLDQTRINVTLDGCPWNEAEDYGVYFANSPDLMSSMHSIKVEKGSSSSYNGIAGIAGGVALESVNLYKDTTSYVYLGSGSFGSLKTTGVYNMGNKNGWGLHIKATHQQSNGFRQYGFNKSQALTVKTGYRFGNGATIDLMSINGTHRNGQGWIGNTLEELAVTPNANGNTECETDNWFMTMNRLQYKQMFDNTVLTASAYYQYQTGSYRFDLDNYMDRMVGEVLNSGAVYDYGLTHNMVGANVAVKHYLDDVTLTYGVNGYTYNRRHFLGDKSVNVDTEYENYDNVGFKNDLSAYAMVGYKPLKNLSVSGNLQYRFVDFHYDDVLNPDMSFKAKDMGTLWNFVNFGFNAEYLPVDNLKTYARFNYINREPTRSDMFGGNESFGGEVNTIVPEVAKDLEIGVEYGSKTVYLSLNGYHMWFNNELVLNGEYGLNGLPCHENVSNSYRRGVEVEFDWNFVNDFNVRLASGVSQNKINTESLGVKNHILSPAVTFDGDLFYDNDVIKVGVNTNYRSKMYIDTVNENSIPYLLTVNLYADYKVGQSEFGIRLNNVTDRVNYTNAAIGANGQVLYFRNAPMNFNVFVKYSF